jgi:hypothetical protein
LESAGAALGGLGMLVFAVIFSLLVQHKMAEAFFGALLGWLVVAIAAWYVRRRWRSVSPS